jgi:hypothetical protein
MSNGFKLTALLIAGALCLPIAGRADTQNTTPRTRSKKKTATLPPPLPSGTRGPVPQIPLDSIPAVAPEVTFGDGMLTIVAPNSTLGDILRSVKKHTSADIEVPPTASERVVTRLGPAPARQVMAELLNGSHFNYILLGSPLDANSLTRVVLVAKTGPDNPAPAPTTPGEAPVAAAPPQPVPAADAPEADAVEEQPDDNADQSAEAEQPAPQDQQPGVRTPAQLLQEMQQRQLMIQQQQGNQPGPYQQPGMPVPGMPIPHQPQPPQEQQ